MNLVKHFSSYWNRSLVIFLSFISFFLFMTSLQNDIGQNVVVYAFTNTELSSPLCSFNRMRKINQDIISLFTTSNDSIYQEKSKISLLARALRVVCQSAGTLGVYRKLSEDIEIVSDLMEQDNGAKLLVQAAWEAGNRNNNNMHSKQRKKRQQQTKSSNIEIDKGMVAGILNALLASTVISTPTDNKDRENKIDDCSQSHWAVQLMHAYDEELKGRLQPDLVTLCLAFDATHRNHPKEASTFLQRAQEFYPKVAYTNATFTTSRQSLSNTVDWKRLQLLHDIHLIQEDNDFVVLSKPSGMVCYHTPRKTLSSLKRGHKRKQKRTSIGNGMSLEDCLIEEGMPLSTLNMVGSGMVHRLDAGTSGCMILAKTNSMHARLVSIFFRRKIYKSYRALVSTTIAPSDKPILLSKIPTTIDLDIDGRPAASNVVMNRILKSASNSNISICEVHVETQQGRRHQVRKHLSQGKLNAPILLDPLYGGMAILRQFPCLQQVHLDDKNQRFCLHADNLRIQDNGIDIQATVDAPAWWKEIEKLIQVETI